MEKFPKTKKDLEKLLKKHKKIVLYCEDYSEFEPGLSSTGGKYGYWAKTSPITLENIDEVVWEFHTTSDLDYCSLCGGWHHESRCHLLQWGEVGYEIFDGEGNIKYPYQDIEVRFV